MPAFRFRPFERYADVADEMAAARLVFLEPHQLELLPDRQFDVSITISTLQEMRPEQIAKYLALLDAKTASAIYLKQWRRWRNTVDDVVVSMADYGLPAGWGEVFNRRPLVPREFFEALYVRTGGA
jgi:hypothetical protein